MWAAPAFGSGSVSGLERQACIQDIGFFSSKTSHSFGEERRINPQTGHTGRGAIIVSFVQMAISDVETHHGRRARKM